MKHITKVRELYEETIHWISKSEDSWKNFLSCMGRLYQLDFLNTCMVYAQRPDASVLAGYDAWHEMDLPVARGSKGIAVFPSKIFGEGVTHVYDIQDVKGQGIRPWNWQVNGTNRRLLARELFPEIYEQEKKFKNSLDAFTRTNVWLMIEEEDEILKSLQKLAVLTGEGQEVKENQITEFLVSSVCYAVESRCGIRDDTLDFSFICGFSENEEILYRTGRLVSHLSGRIVLQIARTMKNIDLERRQYYGRNRRNPVQGNEWRTDTSFRGRDERGEDAGVPEPLAVAISCVGLVACHSIYKKSIIEVISNEVDPNVHRSSKFLRIDKSSSKLRTFWILSLKYVLRDFKTSIFMMLTICMGVSLFYGLFYKAQIAHDIHYETKEMYFFNGEYAMNVLTFQTADYGISRESIKEILSLDKVKEIETATGLPIRVVDNGDVEKNNEYFNASNAKKKEIYGYSDDGFDGEDQVYKSVLYGYNDNALAKLQKYVIDGKFIPEEIKENEVILCEMRESDDKTGIQKVGWYKDGEPLFQYKVGEQISIKYREDMKTGTQDYERFLDNVSDYTTKKYKIVAVVSFPYISDVKYSQYPIFITKDAYIEGLIGDSKIQSMYINGKENLSDEEKIQLENQLINIGTKNSQVSTRSLITERDKADMLYQKEIINIVGIALVFLILALTNIANNMKFRVQTRKRENSILRAIGLKYKAVEEIVILEIANICFVSFIGGYGASQIISRYLYSQSDLKNFGYVYKFDVVIYLLVCLSTLAVCAFISYWIVKKSSSKNIIEDMNYIE